MVTILHKIFRTTLYKDVKLASNFPGNFSSIHFPGWILMIQSVMSSKSGLLSADFTDVFYENILYCHFIFL